MMPRPARWIASAAAIGFAIPAAADYQLEYYTSHQAFLERVGAVRVIDFDDVPSAADPNEFTAFESDRYIGSGVSITGGDGQYASQGFVWPLDFPAVSSPNTYAPGPIAPIDALVGSGGHDTDVTFHTPGADATVAGFGIWFIDADYPGIGASSFTIFNELGGEVGTTGTVSGSDASQLFVGVVAVDTGSLEPTPVIARVHVVNGSGWPGVNENEGVVLDDLMFTTPVPEPAATPGALAVLGTLAGCARLIQGKIGAS